MADDAPGLDVDEKDVKQLPSAGKGGKKRMEAIEVVPYF